jgi:uncharacterized damage-inducible protein DinB
MEDLRYPIGNFAYAGTLTAAGRDACITRIAAAPAKVRAAVTDLSGTQIDTPYRPGGWTVRQVVHHLPDSHLNAYTRFHLALTEKTPTIRPYEEALWAELSDGRSAPVEFSLDLLDALHARWVFLLRRLGTEDWSRAFIHPGHGREMTLDETLAMYAWHGEHHVAHITSLRTRMGWT